MNSEHYGDRDESLQELFRQYRDACPTPEPGPNFMPLVWRKIDARQANNSLFGRMARGFATAAFALSCILALFLALPGGQSAFETGTYVDVLAADHANENALYFDAVHLSPVRDTVERDAR